MQLILLILISFSVVAEDLNGWDYLYSKLVSNGLDSKLVKKSVQKLPPFGFIPFKLKPIEKHHSYSSFKNKTLINKARNKLIQFKDVFKKAEKIYAVDKEVIAAILLVETQFGENVGSHNVFNRLARVCSIGEENNLKLNFLEHKKINTKVKFIDTKKRAEYLEKEFCKEIIALFKIKSDFLNLKGSIAGAFGIPQFMPSSFIKYAIDFDDNKIVDLYTLSDAIGSTANFLEAHGYLNNQKEAVWGYNHSQAYNDTVFYIAKSLGYKG